MPPSSRATIVVVERNSAAQELIDQTLREHGHRVLVTTDPVEALNLAERVRIDLLVGDVELCEEAPDLLERLRLIQPGVQVLRISEPGELQLSELDSGVTLGRPFSLSDLENAVASALSPDG